jgi:CheY-like chemotaxis protein
MKYAVGKRILVVEDEPSISLVCARVLTAEGAVVVVAADGRAAQDKLSTESFDLCLFDIRTPRMNGMELYQFVKQAYPGLTEKVVFTTGDVLSPNIEAFLKGAKRPYLPKPFTPGELRDVVQKALDTRTI